MSLNQKQSAGKQKDGEQTPHYANICTRGSSNRLIPLTAGIFQAVVTSPAVYTSNSYMFS